MGFFETKNLNGKKRYVVCNGNMGGRGGYRALAVDVTGKARPVNHVHRRGANSRKATFQSAEEGDAIFYRNYGDELLTVYEISLGRLEEVKNRERLQWLRTLPLTLEEWLEEEDGKSPNYLPCGYGWDGERTGSEISKFERVIKFLRKVPTYVVLELKPFILETKGHEMPTSFRYRATPLPRTMSPADYWVLFLKHGVVTVIPDLKEEQAFHRDVVKAIKINIFRNDYCMRWDLFDINAQWLDAKGRPVRGHRKGESSSNLTYEEFKAGRP